MIYVVHYCLKKIILLYLFLLVYVLMDSVLLFGPVLYTIGLLYFLRFGYESFPNLFYPTILGDDIGEVFEVKILKMEG